MLRYLDKPGQQFLVMLLIHQQEEVDRDDVLEIARRLTECERFKRAIVERGRWKVPSFEGAEVVLEDHVRMHDFTSLKEKEEYLDVYMSKLAELRGEDFDEGKPLWRIDVITPGLRGGSTCIFQFHHCLSDGMGLVLFAVKNIVDKDPLLVEEISDRVDSIVRKRRGGSLGTRLLRGLHYFESYMYALGSVFTHLVIPDASMPSSPFRGKHVDSNKWSMAWSDPIPFAGVKNVSAQLNCTVNQCFLGALGGAVRSYMIQEGFPTDGRVNFAMSVFSNSSVNMSSSKICNNVAFPVYALGVHIEDTEQRIQYLQGHTKRLHRGGHAAMVKHGLKCCGLLPRETAVPVFNGLCRGTSLAISNVHGPVTQLSVLDNPVNQIEAIIPCGGGMGVTMSFLTYRGSIGITSSGTGLSPSGHKLLVALLSEEFKLLTGRRRQRAPGNGLRLPLVVDETAHRSFN
ncbi:hypothetical protein NDN08_001590 [Rhodosorus marinus]|uniref:Diacylglycerol O-acyltransferase n=1 Tax=Rhodosorus marinus TaxID=101924 RepID=A0AAV8USP1_9RHOD|nr:hypothetical protein NDN08_001590 [Rhodosorus marinus]